MWKFAVLSSQILNTGRNTSLCVRECQILSGLVNLLMVSAGQQLCVEKWRSQTPVSEMGSCSPEMLHGVVLSPDYDGPCGTPFVGSLCASNWQTKARDPRGIWPGNSALLWQPKAVSREEATIPRGGWTMDGWTDGWMDGLELYLKWWFPCTRVVIISDSEGTSGLLRLPILNSVHQSCQSPAESVFIL